MSKGWLRAIASNPLLADSITIVGLVDLNRETAEKLAAEFGLDGAVIGSDLSDVITATKADLVFDIVIPAARYDVVSTALKAGCHGPHPRSEYVGPGAAGLGGFPGYNTDRDLLLDLPTHTNARHRRWGSQMTTFFTLGHLIGPGWGPARFSV